MNSHSFYCQISSIEKRISGTTLLGLLQEITGKGKSFSFIATGVSMYPFIRNGDVVTISALGNTPPRCGDVVAFKTLKTGKLFIHRVIASNNGAYLIQGDNVLTSDGYIPESDIIGRVTRVERAGEKIGFGLGSERVAIAFLSRKQILRSFIAAFSKYFRLVSLMLKKTKQ